MTHMPVQLPFKGFTEQSQFSAIPPGMTPSCVNMMPSDIWNGRTRISTRNGTQLYNLGSVQFMGTFRAFIAGALVEKIIFVRAGKVYYADPRSNLTATATEFPGQTTAPLNATGLVEGVQFNEYFYFVDGTHYVKVLLTDTTTGVSVWGATTGNHKGPYHTDPLSSPAGNRATLICRWGARVVLAGYKKTPTVWFACAPDKVVAAAGNGSDDGWTGTDFIGAVSGIGGAITDVYGTLGDPIVAIFPFAQTGLMFACTNSFSFLTSDPEFDPNAQIVSLTKSIGITGQRAFCQSQEKGSFILASDGLYFINANDFNFNRANRVSAGRLDSFFLRLDFGTPAIGGTSPLAGGTLRAITTEGGSGAGADTKTQTTEGGLTSESTAKPIDVGEAVSSLLGGIDAGNVFPCLCYDPDREGVWILLAVNGVENASLHLFYDLKTDSFWPQRFADPNIYAPTSACFVGTSRTDSGRLFLGGAKSISIIDRSYPIGVDGWNEEMTDEDQRRQFVRSSLTFGPIIGQLPYRAMLSEVRIDLADDKYEVPSNFTDRSEAPIVSVSTGDTAQSALGVQTDSLFVINLNPLVIDGGNAAATGSAPLYDGGDPGATPPSPDFVDGRFAARPFGQYTQADPFVAGINRVYNGPGDWIIRWDVAASVAPCWVIERVISTGPNVYQIEYEQITPDEGSPDGAMITVTQDPVAPDIRDNALVSGASFPEASVTEIGSLVPGRNTAKKCRIRSEAIYITVASDGKPWSVERMSVVVSQVGKSRGGV
jgi:hypothetical protein